MHVLILFNPTSGTANHAFVNDIKSRLERRGATVDLYLTRCANDATEYLKNYQGTLDIVASAGGDGTLNEVINGLADRADHGCRIAIIPTGTTNVLAGELGIKSDARALCKMMLNGREREIYPGKFNGRRFIQMVGVGYDAWVVDKVNLALKKKIGKLAYVLSMLKQLSNFGKKKYRFVIDGKEYQANSAVLANGRLYGGKFVISRQANLSAQTVQVLLLQAKSYWSLLLSMLGLPLGIMEKMPGVLSLPAKEVRVEMIDQREPEPVQADGDSLGMLPLHLVMEDRPLRVLVP